MGSLAIASTAAKLPTTLPTRAYCAGSGASPVVTMKTGCPRLPLGRCRSWPSPRSQRVAQMCRGRFDERVARPAEPSPSGSPPESRSSPRRGKCQVVAEAAPHEIGKGGGGSRRPLDGKLNFDRATVGRERHDVVLGGNERGTRNVLRASRRGGARTTLRLPVALAVAGSPDDTEVDLALVAPVRAAAEPHAARSARAPAAAKAAQRSDRSRALQSGPIARHWGSIVAQFNPRTPKSLRNSGRKSSPEYECAGVRDRLRFAPCPLSTDPVAFAPPIPRSGLPDRQPCRGGRTSGDAPRQRS